MNKIRIQSQLPPLHCIPQQEAILHPVKPVYPQQNFILLGRDTFEELYIICVYFT